jgi:putative FmdB family regulatory protein
MPIYAYKCGSCGHAKDVLQKVSDAPLTDCPACGAQAFSKQITAAGFQLKGSGWYATDFRNGSNGGSSSKPAEGSGDAKSSDKPSESKSADSAPAKTDIPTASAGGCGGGCACH